MTTRSWTRAADKIVDTAQADERGALRAPIPLPTEIKQDDGDPLTVHRQGFS